VAVEIRSKNKLAPPIDKYSILRMNRRHILESKNSGELSYYIKLPYLFLKKLKSGISIVLTGSCNAIFQRRLPPKKNDLKSFNHIGRLSIKEAECGLDRIIKHPFGVVEDVVVQETIVSSPS